MMFTNTPPTDTWNAAGVVIAAVTAVIAAVTAAVVAALAGVGHVAS